MTTETQYELQGLFPTPFRYTQIPESFTMKELDWVKKLVTMNNTSNIRSEDSYVLSRKPMQRIRSYIESEVTNFFNAVYSPKPGQNIYLTQSWVNFNRLGESHHLHYHPNSFISGVLYLQAAQNQDQIVFVNTKPPHIRPATSFAGVFNATEWYVPVSTGDLVIFPSTLHHTVPTITTQRERISLAFNTFLSGDVGDEEKLSGLRL